MTDINQSVASMSYEIRVSIRPETVETNENWRDDAACKGRTELFFPAHRERGTRAAIRQASAKAVCASCTVRDQCVKDAMRIPERAFGIWGGYPEDRFARL